MKKIQSLFCAVILIGLVSCSNEASDNNNTKENDSPVTTAPADNPPATPPVQRTEPVEPKKDHVEVKKDTPRTEISIGQKGGSVKTKKGTDVSVDDKGVRVGTKDVKIDIKRDTN